SDVCEWDFGIAGPRSGVVSSHASLIPDSGPSAALRIVAASARIPVSPSAVQPADRHAAGGGARAAGL
ncbi:hypothetical protein QM013_34890, partial [Pseudomonas aeruginosa]|uniref:hypothetical protein n=1 Tax=Pseudomonas aeruginosa TaxID=287 RepID=UPI0028753C53